MYLGIDLGTSNSAVVGNLGTDLKIFKTAEGTDVLPSVIYIDKRGHRLVGGRAYDQTVLAPRMLLKGSSGSWGQAPFSISPVQA